MSTRILGRARRRALQVAVVLAAAAIGLVARAALSHDDQGGGIWAAAFPATPASADTGFSPGAATTQRIGPHQTLIATAVGDAIRVHRRPRSGAAGTRVLHRRRVDGAAIPLTFVVRERRAGWLHVELPTRPNGSTGWIRRRGVRLTATGLAVTVRLRHHELIVRDDGRTILRTSIGVGRAVSPTPHGRYYVTDIIRTGDPGGAYGPYALGLSAHSRVYTSFEGGDGQVGIHGTNTPSGLGHDVSHGCIRVRNAVIRRLAHRLPLGTPVRITG